MSFLKRAQRVDGSWAPLWFGNEHGPQQENPTYGTSRAAIALAGSASAMLYPAMRWLRDAQNTDGGWGGALNAPSSIEEAALATHALAAGMNGTRDRASSSAMERGIRWLIQATDEGTRTAVAPIGLYFARLWYFEELYPLIFAAGAAIRARKAAREI
jgi:squalene-hopene/tetraprenyl-beta-curcumene cyclase